MRNRIAEIGRLGRTLMGYTVNCKIQFCNAIGMRCERCPMLRRGWKSNEVWVAGRAHSPAVTNEPL